MAGCWKRVDSPARGKGSSPTSAAQRSSSSGARSRRGLACRVSGCPGQGKARPGQRVDGQAHRTCPRGMEVTALAPEPPGRGCPPGRAVAGTYAVEGRSVRCSGSGARAASGTAERRSRLRFDRRTSLPSAVDVSRALRDQAEPLRLLDRLGPVAHPQLAIQRRGVLLDRVRRQVQPPAISRLVAPEAISSSTSRSRSDSGGPCGASCGRNTVIRAPPCAPRRRCRPPASPWR